MKLLFMLESSYIEICAKQNIKYERLGVKTYGFVTKSI